MPSTDATGRPLNILHVCDHLGWEGSRMHGVKRLFAWMIPRFDPRRFSVSLVSLRKRDLSEETLDALGIDITYLAKGKFDPSTLPALLKVIDQKRVDILHLHGYGASTFGRIAAALRKLPVVVHEHANLTNTPWFQKIADWFLEPYTDVGLAVSRSTAEFLTGARLVRPDRVRVVYLGAPVREFGAERTADDVAAARLEAGAGPEDLLIGSVTRLHESKGNRFLVDAARLVLDARPHARFVVFGEGPLRPELEAQAAALGLGDRFRFAGFVRDVARTLSGFDISVFPSLWEGTPLTVFEALASGRPIVATDADGLVDVLTPGEDAIVVPKRDSRALADALIRLIDAPEERRRLSAAARATSVQYDIEAFVAKMERLYEILHQHSKTTRRRVTEAADLSFLTGRVPT